MKSLSFRNLTSATLLRGLCATVALAAPLSAVRAQEVATIGFSGPLSGGAALYGRNSANGIKMAIKELNDEGFQVAGKRVRLELEALDDKYTPGETVLNARRLVQQSKAIAVFVPHAGGIYSLQSFNEKENFLVMAYSTTPRITGVGNKLTVRITTDFSAYVDPFVRIQMEAYGKKIGLLPGDHEYARAWTEAFSAAWKKAGGTITATNAMSYNKASDFYSGVSRVLATQPEVLFIGGPSEPTALVVKQARELGFRGGFVVMDQAKLDEMAKVLGGTELLEGSLGVLPISLDRRPGATAFIEKFRTMYGADQEPTQETSYSYAFTHVLAEAMKLAGTTADAQAVRNRMPEALKLLSVGRNSGSFSGIDAAGGALIDPLMGVVRNGRIQLVMPSNGNASLPRVSMEKAGNGARP